MSPTKIVASGHRVVASFQPIGTGFLGHAPPTSACAEQDRIAAAKRMKRRLHVLYSGRVQGVGFRYTVKAVVPGFEVTGAIRNLPDGRVELVAEGLKEELEAFQQAIRDSGLGGLIARE